VDNRTAVHVPVTSQHPGNGCAMECSPSARRIKHYVITLHKGPWAAV